MSIGDGMIWTAGGVAALACAAAAIAWLLRRCGIPGGRMGAAVCGGIIAGVLLGPGVAGRLGPGAFEHAFLGGASERLALEEMAGRHQREVDVVEAAGVTPDYIAELVAKQAREIAPLAEATERARARRRAVLGVVGAGVIAVHVLMVGVVCAPMGRWMRRAFRRGVGAGSGVSIGDAAGAAGMMVVVGLVTPILVLMWILRVPAREAIGVGLAMATPAIGAEARTRLLPAAAIGVIASMLGVGSLIWNGAGAASMAMGAIIVGAVAAMIAITLWGGVRAGRGARRVLGWTMAGLTLPLVAALATMRCDPHAMLGSSEFWVVAATAMLFSSDGRWVGIGWAQKLFPRGTGRGRPGARTWTTASGMVNAGTGLAQLSVGLVLEGAGVISTEALGGIVLGAAAIELSRGVRTRVGRMMDGAGEAAIGG